MDSGFLQHTCQYFYSIAQAHFITYPLFFLGKNVPVIERPRQPRYLCYVFPEECLEGKYMCAGLITFLQPLVRLRKIRTQVYLRKPLVEKTTNKLKCEPPG